MLQNCHSYLAYLGGLSQIELVLFLCHVTQGSQGKYFSDWCASLLTAFLTRIS
jgi:hypothetical protein